MAEGYVRYNSDMAPADKGRLRKGMMEPRVGRNSDGEYFNTTYDPQRDGYVEERSLTGIMFGDPPPWRSALHQRGA